MLHSKLSFLDRHPLFPVPVETRNMKCINRVLLFLLLELELVDVCIDIYVTMSSDLLDNHMPEAKACSHWELALALMLIAN